jgi:hypothetical protein
VGEDDGRDVVVVGQGVGFAVEEAVGEFAAGVDGN